jgi:hypothetical protein
MATRAVIVGKGKSAIQIRRQDHPDALLVAINQAAFLFDEIDYLLANDIEGLYGIEQDTFTRVKNIAIPEYPHFNGWSHQDILYTKIKDKFEAYCPNFLIYNLWTTPKKNTNLPFVDKTISSGDTAISLFAKNFKIKKFDLYGIACGNGYNTEINKKLPNDRKPFGNGWPEDRTKKLRLNIELLKKTYDLDININ